MRSIPLAAGLLLVLGSGASLADELSTTQAEALLQPAMSQDCGSYYTTQGEPDFADIENKPMCVYQPRVTSIKLNGGSAAVNFNKDRHFTEEMSQAWLKDYARMEAHETPSLLFKTLKNHIDKWRAENGGVDRADRYGSAMFRLENGSWKLDSVQQ